MKRILFLLAFIYPLYAYCQLQYLSPVPGSVNKGPNEWILIREGDPFQPAVLQNQNVFKLTGSLSGSHSCSVMLSDDHRTIILKPDEPYACSETVTVDIRSGLITTNGKEVAPMSFSFSIHREYSEAEEKGFAEMISKAENEDDYPEKPAGADSVVIPKLDIAIWKNTTPNPGDVFYDLLDGGNLHGRSWDITNSNGDSIYRHPSSYYINDFKLNHNGYLTIYDRYDSVFDMFDSSYQVVKKFKTQDHVTDNHEIQIFPDGHYYLIGYDPEIVDMTQYNPKYSPSASVLGTVVQEFDSGDHLIFNWDSFDHVIVPEALHENLEASFIDYMHTNSIEEDTDGNIIVSHRHLDQITKIDTKTGEFIWRLGGVNNQFIFTNDTLHFTYQHDVRRLANGDVTVFDNGNWHPVQVSTAKEYALDLDNMTATLVWSYQHPLIKETPLYAHAMGSIQRFENGGTLIDWGWINQGDSIPSMTELDANSQIVWEAKVTPDTYNVIYRAHRYPWTPCARVSPVTMKVARITPDSAILEWSNATNALSYRIQYCDSSSGIWQTVKVNASTDTFFVLGNLQPATVYEWRMQSFCSAPNPDSSNFTAIQKFNTLYPTAVSEVINEGLKIFPNPANGSAVVELPAAKKDAELFILNDLGAEMRAQVLKPGEQEMILDCHNLGDGIYLVKIISGANTFTGKLTIQNHD